MFNTISNQVFYTLGLYDIWNMLDNQQKETLTEAINIGIDEGIKQVSVEPVVSPKIAEEKNCEVLGCNAKAVSGGDYCKPHNNGMIGCAVIVSIMLLYFIYYIITKI